MTDSPTIEQYRTAYDQADTLAREVAEFLGDAAIPAHNQLRYAGHHLLQAIDSNGQAIDPTQLRRAISHCERATYEAAEAGIAYAVECIHDFKRDYWEINIRKSLPDWPEHLKAARDATDLIVVGREHKTPSDYMQKFRKLVEVCRFLEDARTDLNAELLQIRTQRRRFLTQMGLMVLLAVVTMSATVVIHG
jgi:hypothetical protein